jgi:copper oxidase (laccase) domain-containing protein
MLNLSSSYDSWFCLIPFCAAFEKLPTYHPTKTVKCQVSVNSRNCRFGQRSYLHFKETSEKFPVYEVFGGLEHVTGAFTGKGTARENYHFSFQRSGIELSALAGNLESYAGSKGFDISRVTWPNGAWPHSGQAIIAEEHIWEMSPYTRGIIPVSQILEPVAYDAIVTGSLEYVLGVQGADCPSIFLYDPNAKVIGLAHSGWKPTVRGVVRNTISCMKKLGVAPENIVAFLSPGVSDRYNEFQWDDQMEEKVRMVFTEANRQDLLTDKSIRYKMNEADLKEVKNATGNEPRGGIALMLSSLIKRDLVQEGVLTHNIEVSNHSTICERLIHKNNKPQFLYHSARRDAGKDPERPGFGSNLCILFLRHDR